MDCYGIELVAVGRQKKKKTAGDPPQDEGINKMEDNSTIGEIRATWDKTPAINISMPPICNNLPINNTITQIHSKMGTISRMDTSVSPRTREEYQTDPAVTQPSPQQHSDLLTRPLSIIITVIMEEDTMEALSLIHI